MIQAGAAERRRRRRRARPGTSWTASSTASARARSSAVEVEGTQLIVAMVDGSMLAYLDRCPSCDSALAGGELSDGVLACPGCERRYFLPRAGRSLDDERLHLGPVPLLATGGSDPGGAARDERASNGQGRPIEDKVAARRRSTMVANLRRLASGAPGAAGRRSRHARGGLRPLRRRHPGEAQPPAAAGRNAGSSASARAAGRSARPIPSTGRPAAGVLWLEGFELAGRGLGAAADPDRARLLHVEQRHRLDGRACTRARPARPSPSWS